MLAPAAERLPDGLASAHPPPIAPRARRAPRVAAALRLLIGMALLAFLATRVDLEGLRDVWRARTLAAVGIAVLLVLAAQLCSALRWSAILGAESPSYLYLFRLYLVGQFFSLFLPTAVGGDVVRTVAAARAVPRLGAALSSVLLDRLFGLAALGGYLLVGVAASLALPYGPPEQLRWTLSPRTALAAGLVALALAAVATLLRARLRRLAAIASDAWALVRVLARSPAQLARVALLALLVQAIYIAVWITLSVGLALPVPLPFFLVAVPIVSLVAMLPVTIAGLGLREGAWLLLLAPFSVPASHALALGALYFLAFAIVGALGGLWFVTRGTEPGPRRTP